MVALKILGHKTEAVYRRHAIVTDSDVLQTVPEPVNGCQVWTAIEHHANPIRRGAAIMPSSSEGRGLSRDS